MGDMAGESQRKQSSTELVEDCRQHHYPTALEQAEFLRPVHRIPSFVHVQLAVDALAVRSDSAHGDGQFLSDLWVGQSGGQQPQYVHLALA